MSYRSLDARPTAVSAAVATALFCIANAALAQEPAGNASTLPEVNVTAATDQTATGPVNGFVAKKTLTGSKTETPLLETPQSVSVVTRDEMNTRGAQNLIDALAYTPGVGAPYPDPNGDWQYIRGFFASQYLDGLRVVYSGGGGAVTMRTETWGLERVEVLRGPASVLYGTNAPGGIANSVSKRPTAEPIRELQVQYGSFDRKQAAFDIGGAIDEDGKLSYRLNGLIRDAGTSVDGVKNNRRYFAPAITWRPSGDTSFTLLAHYLSEDLSPRNFIPSKGTLFVNPLGQIARDRNLGEPDYNIYTREQHAVGYAFEHRFNEALTLRQNFRFTDVNAYSRAISPTSFANLQADNRTVLRSASQAWRQSQTTNVDTHLEAKFDTGPVKHTSLVGFDYSQYEEDTRSASATARPIDIFNPVYGTLPTSAYTFAAPTLQKQERPGVYLQDQAALGNWRFTLAGRYEQARTSTRNQSTLATTARLEDSAFTKRLAALYLFENGVAPYVSYSESFEPISGTDFFGKPFIPTKGVLYETGVRYQPKAYNALFSAAVYQQKQKNNTMTDPDPTHVCAGGTQCSVQTGELRTQGIELEAKLTLENGVNLTAAYAYTAGKYLKASAPAQDKAPTSLAPHTASVWADYEVKNGPLNGLGFGAGARYTGKMWLDAGNTQKIASFTLVDAMLRYDLAKLDPKLKGARLAFNIQNLFDKVYYPGICSTNYCLYGEGRTATATLSYGW
ncbi:TonB-dependent siderophore receptor [Herbaspirillum lusitanum]|uniref:TonB-dependent siderophore receptor n=1 Tax=Herbaspirillum lusitanum TaxID=213312 RepID=UPI002237A5FB|nr:TonB-dependent siderophore receptor [Herbaspirillum lusitanum]MCW5296593.1 TonB-dependent siderophore receptor [Herbaspirillum lusitanum]